MQKKCYTLLEIEKLLRLAGKTLKDYPKIEQPDYAELQQLGNRLVNEEMNYDKNALMEEYLRIEANLNSDQKKA